MLLESSFNYLHIITYTLTLDIDTFKSVILLEIDLIDFFKEIECVIVFDIFVLLFKSLTCSLFHVTI